MGEVSIFRGGWEVKKRILSVFLVLAIVASFVVMAVPVGATGATVFTSQTTTNTGWYGITSAGPLSQAFTVGSTNYVNSISVDLMGTTVTTGDVVLDLCTVKSNGWEPLAIIATASPLPVVNIVSTEQIYSFQFDTPVLLTSLQTYAIMLVVDSGNIISWGYSPCTGEGGFAGLQLTSGQTWVNLGTAYNFWFQEYGTSTQPPQFSTQAATSLGDTTATLNGYVTGLGSLSSLTVMFSWGLTGAYGTNSGTLTVTGANTSISFPATGLLPGTTYHYSLMVLEGGTYFSNNDVTFTTTGATTTTTPTTTTIPTSTTTTTTSFSPYTLYENDTDSVSGYVDIQPSTREVAQGFTPSSTHYISEVSFYMWQSLYNYAPALLNIKLYAATITTYYQPTGSPLYSTSCLTSTVLKGTSGSIAGSWINITLSSPQLVTNALNYCWVITATSLGSYSLTNNFDVGYTNHLSDDTGVVSNDSGSTWGSISYPFDPQAGLLFKNYGSTVLVPSIVTYGATYSNGVYTFSGNVTSLGIDGTSGVSVEIDLGPDTGYGMTINNSNMPAGFPSSLTTMTTTGVYHVTLNASQIPSTWGTVIHYRAAMTGVLTGVFTVGSDETTPLISTVPVDTGSGPGGNTQGVYLTTSKASNITQTSAYVTGTITDGGNETLFSSVGIQIDSSSDFSHNNTPIILATNTDFTSLPFVPVLVSGLTAGTKYYIRMEAQGSLQTDPYLGNTVSFITLTSDSSGGGGGSIINWLNLHSISAAYLWILLFFLMGAVWILRLKDVPTIICVILDMVLLGGFIALGLLDIWLLGLLALVGAAICFVLIRKTVGGGT